LDVPAVGAVVPFEIAMVSILVKKAKKLVIVVL
jgi:hypothetical protein